MVVVQHSQHLVHNGMVQLTNADVYAEDGVYYAEYQAVKQVSNGWTYSLLVVEAIRSAAGRLCGRLLLGRRWKIWFQ